MTDILVKVGLWAATGLGVVLAVYAVITVGFDGRARRQTWLWGSANKMSRTAFASYFGALGISVSLAAHVTLFFRNASSFRLLVAAPAIIGSLLLIGWAYMALRGNRES